MGQNGPGKYIGKPAKVHTIIVPYLYMVDIVDLCRPTHDAPVYRM